MKTEPDGSFVTLDLMSPGKGHAVHLNFKGRGEMTNRGFYFRWTGHFVTLTSQSEQQWWSSIEASAAEKHQLEHRILQAVIDAHRIQISSSINV